MPPKPKFTKETIIEVAFRIVEEKGVDYLSARTLAKELNCGISPIFTVFKNMAEIKEAVFLKSKKILADYLNESINYFPAFKEFGLRCIRFAISKPNIYSMLFGTKLEKGAETFEKEFSEIIEPMLHEISNAFALEYSDAKVLLNQMLFHGNSIGYYLSSEHQKISEEIVGEILSTACIGIVLVLKTKSGTLNFERANQLVNAIRIVPFKKHEKVD